MLADRLVPGLDGRHGEDLHLDVRRQQRVVSRSVFLSLPGFWERILARAEVAAAAQGRAVVLLDEVPLLHDWTAHLKGIWDRFKRNKTAIHVVATGSSALHHAAGSRESLAGRFERLTLSHWSAASLSRVFKIDGKKAADLVVRMGSYPGAYALRNDVARWSAYVRDAILEPAIGRDILALAAVRRPALLRQDRTSPTGARSRSRSTASSKAAGAAGLSR